MLMHTIIHVDTYCNIEGLTAKWPAYARFPIHNTL